MPKTARVRQHLIRTLRPNLDSVPAGVTPYVVFAMARTGSSLLCERLATCWTTVRNDREIFNKTKYGDRAFEIALGNTYFLASGHRFIGCKAMADQLSDTEVRKLLSLPGMRVVLLSRENYVRQFVSLQIALRNQVWYLKANAPPIEIAQRRIHVKGDELVEFAHMVQNRYKRFDQLIGPLPIMRVTYEGMTKNLDIELRKIGAFLGAGDPNREIPPHTKVQNPEPLSSLIENFDELCHQLRAGDHADLLSMIGK